MSNAELSNEERIDIANFIYSEQMTEKCSLLSSTGDVYRNQDDVPCKLLRIEPRYSFDSSGNLLNTSSYTFMLPLWVNIKLGDTGSPYILHKETQLILQIQSFDFGRPSALYYTIIGKYFSQEAFTYILVQNGEPGDSGMILTSDYEYIQLTGDL
jgi:hypothetical protein